MSVIHFQLNFMVWGRGWSSWFFFSVWVVIEPSVVKIFFPFEWYWQCCQKWTLVLFHWSVYIIFTHQRHNLDWVSLCSNSWNQVVSLLTLFFSKIVLAVLYPLIARFRIRSSISADWEYGEHLCFTVVSQHLPARSQSSPKLLESTGSDRSWIISCSTKDVSKNTWCFYLFRGDFWFSRILGWINDW